MTNEIEWVRSGRARDMLFAAGMDYPDFKLQQALLIGKVRSQAASAEITAWRKPTKTFADYHVPPDAWKGGELSLEFDSYLKSGCALRGLSFSKTDLIEWFELSEEPFKAVAIAAVGTPEVTTKAGRPAKSDEWGNLLAAVVAYAQCKGIDLADQPGEVYTKALDYAATLGMAETAISIDRCRPAILLAKKLIAKGEGGEAISA